MATLIYKKHDICIWASSSASYPIRSLLWSARRLSKREKTPLFKLHHDASASFTDGFWRVSLDEEGRGFSQSLIYYKLEIQVALVRTGTQTWNLTSNFLFKWSNKRSAVKTTMSASEMKSSTSIKFHMMETRKHSTSTSDLLWSNIFLCKNIVLLIY